jgi:hypothetical protein
MGSARSLAWSSPTARTKASLSHSSCRGKRLCRRWKPCGSGWHSGGLVWARIKEESGERTNEERSRQDCA